MDASDKNNIPMFGDFRRFCLRPGDVKSFGDISADSAVCLFSVSSLKGRFLSLDESFSFLNFLRHDFDLLKSPSPRSPCPDVLYS